MLLLMAINKYTHRIITNSVVPLSSIEHCSPFQLSSSILWPINCFDSVSHQPNFQQQATTITQKKSHCK